MIVFLNGKFLDENEAKISVFDHGFLYGDGVYETLRTYDGKIWQLVEHLKRLGNSAKLLGIKMPWSSKQLQEWITETVKLNGFEESRVRVTVSRGVNEFDFVTCKKPTLCIQVQKLVPEPAKVYKNGVSVVSFLEQRDVPTAKTISLLPMVMGRRFMADKKAYEAIFVDQNGFVLEGTVTNVFMVKDGILCTPVSNILLGTTRQFILKEARQLGIKTREKDFKLAQLYQADEVFITNAPRGVVPVVKIDNKKIGNGKPGKLTLKISLRLPPR